MAQQKASGNYSNSYLFNGKELDEETGLYYYGARYYNPRYSVWHGVDPMVEERSWMSPYNYCQNNPVRRIDPTGALDYEWETKYVNQKGEILYETNDGLSDVIIVPGQNTVKLENKLNEFHQKGQLNDTEKNKQELHKLGVEISNDMNDYKTGVQSFELGYQAGYESGYSGESSVLQDLWFKYGVNIFVDVPDGGYLSVGYREGVSQGDTDERKGHIDRLNAYNSIKNNKPLISLPLNQQNQNKKPKQI